MKFSGENVSSVLGKLKRLAAVRGKLAVNGGKLYQVVTNGKVKVLSLRSRRQNKAWGASPRIR